MSSSPLVAQVLPSGISAPSYSDIITAFKNTIQSIYGTDTDLDPDSQDGQMMAIVGLAVSDTNQLAIAIYNSMSPTLAQGAALSANVKINGITRQQATASTVSLILIGVSGTVIVNGMVRDSLGNLWTIPGAVTIPDGGSVQVMATCQTLGAITADPGTVNQIYTPVPGWQTVSNPSSATVGNPVETDAALRQRQTISTSLAAQTPLNSILAAIANLTGVGRYAIYENDTGSTDSNGVPAHSISVVVEGGTPLDIATTIEEKKTLGTGTYGTTSIAVTDQAGVTITINYFQLALVQVYVSVTIKSLTGYVASTTAIIQQAIVDFINSLKIGEDVYYAWLYGPAGLASLADLQPTFKITGLTSGTSPSPVGTSDIVIAFNQAAACSLANVVITVT